ncbi:MAG: glucose-6-phosphate isomerase [Candidatus Aenigmatarchaeota archaeon]|nr:MAG: glucose-6-phosphate isomerase [Candidatus Aenigmarchaeota archaeon]
MWQLEKINKLEPDIRTLFDIKEVVYDKQWLKNQKDKDLYFMYRNIFKEEDEEKIEKSGLRYDVTVIPPGMLGCEFTKTVGHYHEIAVENLSYPEVYQVLKGEAIFLIQKIDFDTNKIIDVCFSRCSIGDVFVIPPNYGHITINHSNQKLVMSNWVASNFKSVYHSIKYMGGACHFFLNEGWVKNKRYPLVPDLRELQGKKMEDMYSFISIPEKLEFLKNPKIEPEI